MRDMVFMGKCNYGSFLTSAEKISTNILANRLAKLEAAGIISKMRDPDNAAKYIYKLTEKGLDLVPLLLEMVLWSARHEPQIGASDNLIEGAPPNILQLIQEDRDAIVQKIAQQLRTRP